MTLRRYAPMKQSSGTAIPSDLRRLVLLRDGGCVGYQRLPGDCVGGLEIDHVRASHGMGMKSPTTLENCVLLCAGHHRWKTSNGRVARPILLAYLDTVDGGCGHVDPHPGCMGPCNP